MQEDFYDIIAAVISGNATLAQQKDFHTLMASNNHFKQLHQQLVLLYQHPNKSINFFDAIAALEKLKERLGNKPL